MLIFVYLLTDFYLFSSDIKVIFSCHNVSSILFLSACFQAKKGGLLHLGIRSPLKRKKLVLPLIIFNCLDKHMERQIAIKLIGKRAILIVVYSFK
ncbi:hypothetical protein GBS1014_0628 [Streptococcus agalactiae SS1014]|nr:hypothetical protein GBS1014_0628 [Streptococcus agalactiae SS1014]